MSADRTVFERAFIATSYLLGRRGDELVAGTGELGPATQRLLGGLSRAEKNERARVLAGELVKLVKALDARRLW